MEDKQTKRYFFSDETQLKNAKMAAVLLSKLLGKISLLPVREVVSRTAVWNDLSEGDKNWGLVKVWCN